ncbi:unnamed protein product [Prorocentrum cordatum]|uniref:DUF4116 domain-containing protein n=1 Tax=Prorocentrum cordatum TaxID=2364126 RepID=A0ABN9XUP5_9DINO|nr:unnamed protein product [Polarella glacialis]
MAAAVDPAVRRAALCRVREDGRELQNLSEDRRAAGQAMAAEPFRRDKEAVLAAVLSDGLALAAASEELRADREVVSAAVRYCGLALHHASRDLRSDPEVVRLAVRSHGLALNYASDELRADRSTVLAAVRSHGLGLLYAAPELRQDPEILIAALRGTGDGIARVASKNSVALEPPPPLNLRIMVVGTPKECLVWTEQTVPQWTRWRRDPATSQDSMEVAVLGVKWVENGSWHISDVVLRALTPPSRARNGPERPTRAWPPGRGKRQRCPPGPTTPLLTPFAAETGWSWIAGIAWRVKRVPALMPRPSGRPAMSEITDEWCIYDMSAHLSTTSRATDGLGVAPACKRATMAPGRRGAPAGGGEATDGASAGVGEDAAADGDKAAAPALEGGWKGFCRAFASIMSRELDQKAPPVLCDTQIAQKLKEKREELKEQRALALQRKALKDQGHTLPDITQKAFEMNLRKIATQGVVRLFNTVQQYHQRGDADISSQASKVHIKQRGKKMADASREKFQRLWETQGQPKAKRRKQSTSGGVAAASGGMDELAEFG